MSYSPLFRGSVAKGASAQTQTSYANATGSSIAAAVPVASNTAGNLVLVDVTNESTVENWVGLTSAAIANGATGSVVNDGRIENIPLGLGFSLGDTIWVANTPGTLTNVKPDLTVSGWVAGDFVLFVGVVVVNQTNPTYQDIQLSRQIVGQL